jgi:hypothetical protein
LALFPVSVKANCWIFNKEILIVAATSFSASSSPTRFCSSVSSYLEHITARLSIQCLTCLTSGASVLISTYDSLASGWGLDESSSRFPEASCLFMFNIIVMWFVRNNGGVVCSSLLPLPSVPRDSLDRTPSSLALGFPSIERLIEGSKHRKAKSPESSRTVVRRQYGGSRVGSTKIGGSVSCDVWRNLVEALNPMYRLSHY